MSGYPRDGKKKGAKRSTASTTKSKKNQFDDSNIKEIKGKRFDDKNRPLVLVSWKNSDTWTWESPQKLDHTALGKIADFETKVSSQIDTPPIPKELELSFSSSSSSGGSSRDSSRASSVCSANGSPSQHTHDPILSTAAATEAPFSKSIGTKTKPKKAKKRSRSGSGSSSRSSSTSSSSSSCSSNNSSSSESSQHKASSSSIPPCPWDVNLGKEYPSGLKGNYPLDKICHAHKIMLDTFLVVKWKSLPYLDLVKITDLSKLYSGDILEYFGKLPKVGYQKKN